MKLIKGNIIELWDDFNYVCVTTNSMLNTRGELVMGAGVAKAFKIKDHTLPKKFGDQIKSGGFQGSYYGLLKSGKVIAFQTKRNWKGMSNYFDVKDSIMRLGALAMNFPHKSIGLPFPAITNGGLNREEILPLLEKYLPDSVTVLEL